MSFEQQPKSDSSLDDALEKARREASERENLVKKESGEKEFDPEAERQKIYTRANERMDKLFQFRQEVFGEAGKALDKEKNVPFQPGESRAFSDAHGRALDKKYKNGRDDPDETKLTYEEKAALLYQIKYNEIQRDMELAIENLEERIKASKPEQSKPEELQAEEPKVEELKPEDIEKRMSEI